MHSQSMHGQLKYMLSFLSFVLKSFFFKEKADAKAESRHNRAQLRFAPLVSFPVCFSAFSDLFLLCCFQRTLMFIPIQKNLFKVVCHPQARLQPPNLWIFSMINSSWHMVFFTTKRFRLKLQPDSRIFIFFLCNV